MTTSTTKIINSLEGYVLDIKPYHSKLSEIVVEFAFFDDLNVHMTDEHKISTLLNSIWSQDYISTPASVSSRYKLRAPYTNPTFLNFRNNVEGSEYDQSIDTQFGYKLFNQRARDEVKLIKKRSPLNYNNLIPQLEGHDFFQTFGAFSFETLPNNEFKILTNTNDGIPDLKTNLSVKNGAPLETWSIVKVNPIGYSRPILNLANAPTFKITNISNTIVDQKFTITNISPGVFEVVGSKLGLNGKPGPADNTVTYNTQTNVVFGGLSAFSIRILPPVGLEPYTTIVGDYFIFELLSEPLIDYYFSNGYDYGNYDSPFYDDRQTTYQDSDLNFVKLQHFINEILELEAIDNVTFSVTLFNRTDYLNGVKTVSQTLPNLTVGTPYSSVYFTLDILDPFDGFAPEDRIVIDTSRTSGLQSVNMPFVHIYGTSYTDLPTRKWNFTAISDSEFTVPGYPRVYVNKAYDSNEVHFTVYSSLIRISVNDTFKFDVYRDKPSYKVFGSVSEEQEMATVGVPYDNGKIAFTLNSPMAKISVKHDPDLGGPINPREEYAIFDGTLGTLVVNSIPFKFDRLIRSDAGSDTYKFKYIAANNSFAVTSTNGVKLGLNFDNEYEWTDRLQNSTLSQDLSFDNDFADGNLSFTLLKSYLGNTISFVDGYEFYIDIVDHGFPLSHSHNGLLFTEVEDEYSFVIEDLVSDRLSLSIDHPNADILKSNDSIGNSHNPSTFTQWGISSATKETKKTEIALITKRNQEIADIGTLNVDIYAANKPSSKVGQIRQSQSGLNPVIDFEQDFVNDYMGFMGTKFNVKVEQGSIMNTLAKTKITDSFRMTTKTNYSRFRDYEGYDVFSYDNELNHLAFELGYTDDPLDDAVSIVNSPGYPASLKAQFDLDFLNPAQYIGYDLDVTNMMVVGILVMHPEFIDASNVHVTDLFGVPLTGLNPYPVKYFYDDFGQCRGTLIKVWVPPNNDDFTVIIN